MRCDKVGVVLCLEAVCDVVVGMGGQGVNQVGWRVVNFVQGSAVGWLVGFATEGSVGVSFVVIVIRNVVAAWGADDVEISAVG